VDRYFEISVYISGELIFGFDLLTIETWKDGAASEGVSGWSMATNFSAVA
jgi:hypothetical protein